MGLFLAGIVVGSEGMLRTVRISSTDEPGDEPGDIYFESTSRQSRAD
jgi:hypothetical protein